MYLTIWRHGEAGYAVTDRQRELTRRGELEVEQGAAAFVSLCDKGCIATPKKILYSEWRRTSQTTSIISASLPGASLETSQSLIPGRRATEVDTMLAEMEVAAPEHLMLVSHQPLVSTLIDYYLGDAGRVPPLVPGGLATISLDVVAPACGSLVWCIQPPGFEVMA